MRIAVIGTGYVGSVTGACFAEMGNTVVCVDKDRNKIDQFESGTAPLHEKGLDELVTRNLKNGTLSFTTDFKDAVQRSDVVFIAVGTPPNGDGSADLSHVLAVADDLGRNIDHEIIVVDKSTVPVGTAALVSDRISSRLKERGADISFSVVSNPEFLAQGTAVKDFLEPSRIVVGSDDQRAIETMRELYEPFMRREGRFFAMDAKTAEIVKYASNCFLAMKISAANELANICSKVGADYEHVRKAMGADPRIGDAFLYASAGFGGSCFPKDVKALVKTAADFGFEAGMLKQTLDTNEKQKLVLAGMVEEKFGTDLTGKAFGIWGLAFKAGTDDMRESPALSTVNELVRRGATVRAHDPEAMRMARTPEYFGENPSISYFEDKYEALEGTEAMIVITEWKEFRTPDFDRIRTALRSPIIFDGRLLYEPKKMIALGFEYHSIGRA
ncbi:MAG: UDP-glucose/GDP-mannose dehydrogenase family protein [Candidatus Moranbacteria bacterium]|nr:UDP-glucose/GDP-mannose dehydrogenase family protein [Candidatus Moranbacteria bacterium]